jgi:hypothetical protein
MPLGNARISIDGGSTRSGIATCWSASVRRLFTLRAHGMVAAMLPLVEQLAPRPNDDAFQAVLDNIPVTIEGQLPWEQVRP